MILHLFVSKRTEKYLEKAEILVGFLVALRMQSNAKCHWARARKIGIVQWTVARLLQNVVRIDINDFKK